MLHIMYLKFNDFLKDCIIMLIKTDEKYTKSQHLNIPTDYENITEESAIHIILTPSKMFIMYFSTNALKSFSK